MYVAASLIGLIAIGLLVENIVIFNATVAQYVAQGYPSSQVLQQLIPSQLLPGVFESIAVYGGIAFILFGVGMTNQRFSRYLVLADTQVDTIDGNTHVKAVEVEDKAVDERRDS